MEGNQKRESFMKIFLVITSLMLSTISFSQDKSVPSFNLRATCSGLSSIPTFGKATMKTQLLGSTGILLIDEGFCAAYNFSKTSDATSFSLTEKPFVFSGLSDVERQIFINKKLAEIEKFDLMKDLSNSYNDNDELNFSKTYQKYSLTNEKDKWKIRFYASHSFTKYFKFDRYFSTRLVL